LYFLKIHFNIILPHTPRLPKRTPFPPADCMRLSSLVLGASRPQVTSLTRPILDLELFIAHFSPTHVTSPSRVQICRSALCTTCLPATWSRGLLEKLTVSQLVKKFPAFYGTRRFITLFTTARHLSLSWASSIQSMPPPHFKIHCNIILSSTPGCPSDPPTEILYAPPFSPHACYMPRPSHSSRFDYQNNTHSHPKVYFPELHYVCQNYTKKSCVLWPVTCDLPRMRVNHIRVKTQNARAC
jgi:hypothetical protein